MAGEFYEIMARESNTWYKQHPNQRGFVEAEWGKFLAAAKATLAHMLTLPIDEKQKALIQEALILDNPLAVDRARQTKALPL